MHGFLQMALLLLAIPGKPSVTAAKFDPVTNSRRIVFSSYPSRSPTAKDHPTPSLKRMQPSLLTCDSPPTLFYRQFNHVISLAEATPSPFPIGALTSDNRDPWTDARSALMDASPKNAELLQKIGSAMIVVALDDSKPVTQDDISWETWAGNGRNR